uniref:Uncharacterized protein n=1 Tax=Anguilla anguilla TaxID=7936 RepID=A0A0E9Q7U5_ANGAN
MQFSPLSFLLVTTLTSSNYNQFHISCFYHVLLKD